MSATLTKNDENTLIGLFHFDAISVSKVRSYLTQSNVKYSKTTKSAIEVAKSLWPTGIIIYVATIWKLKELIQQLPNFPTMIYHGQLSDKERSKTLLEWANSDNKAIMVATKALGLGVRTSAPIQYVLFEDAPDTVYDFMQASGRVSMGEAILCNCEKTTYIRNEDMKKIITIST